MRLITITFFNRWPALIFVCRQHDDEDKRLRYLICEFAGIKDHFWHGSSFIERQFSVDQHILGTR